MEENVIDNSINFAKVQGRFYLTGTDFTKTSELVKLSVLTSPKIYTLHFQFSLYSTSLNSYDRIKVKKSLFNARLVSYLQINLQARSNFIRSVCRRFLFNWVQEWLQGLWKNEKYRLKLVSHWYLMAISFM